MQHRWPLQLALLAESLTSAMPFTNQAMKARVSAAPEIHSIFFKVRKIQNGSGITDIFCGFPDFREGRPDQGVPNRLVMPP